MQEQFEAFVEARCVSHGELFGGKICAALDRQHPRHLFDVKRLLDQEGLTENVRLGAIARFVSHGRPIAELVDPAHKDQRETFRSQFDGMPFEPFSYDDHQATLEHLVNALRGSFTDDDRAFLLSFEAGDPDWGRFPIATLAELPAPQFKLTRLVQAAGGAALLLHAALAVAQAWPAKPVKVVVPYATGGSTDTTARLVAQALSQKLGQQFIVENRPGAGGTIGHDQGAKAAADGYTLLFSSAGPLTVTPRPTGFQAQG